MTERAIFAAEIPSFTITATLTPNCADKKTHPMRENEFDFIRGLVYEHSRINLGPDKRELVSARLGKRLRATNLASVTDYCQLLKAQSDGEELAMVVRRGTIVLSASARCQIGGVGSG